MKDFTKDKIEEIPEDSNEFLNQEEIEEEIKVFLDGFFAKTKEIIDFENNNIREYQFQEPSVDYTRVRRFLISAINNLHSIDNKLVNGLLLKLYKDEESLYEAYVDYQSRNRITAIVFEKHFLGNLKQYKTLATDLENIKAKVANLESLSKTLDHKLTKLKIDLEELEGSEYKALEKEIKQTNKRLADAYFDRESSHQKLIQLNEEMKFFKETLSVLFKDAYETKREHYFKEWRKVINIKCYYLDKLLWFEASESTMVQKFFLNSDIEGNYDIKTFIKYYLKNIDSEKSKNAEWHNYLHSVIKVLE
jgi:regulator of replication initiation timing